MNFLDYTYRITKDFLYYTKKEKDGTLKVIEKPNTLTLQQIRNEFRKIDFTKFYLNNDGRNRINENLENKLILPFNFLFYYLLIKYERIPTPQEFLEKYLECFCEKCDDDENRYYFKEKYRKIEIDGQEIEIEFFDFTYKQILGRVCRAYNAFNREIDLLLHLFQEEDIEATYDFQKDYKEGVDITVKYNGQMKTIGCYQDTDRGEYFLERKHTIRREKDVDIRFPLTRKNTKVIGDIWVYSDKAIEDLIKKNIKGEDENE